MANDAMEQYSQKKLIRHADKSMPDIKNKDNFKSIITSIYIDLGLKPPEINRILYEDSNAS